MAAEWETGRNLVRGRVDGNPPKARCPGYIIVSSMDFDDVSQAIKKGDVVRLRRYLDMGGDADLSNRNGWTLLMCAAFEGNTAVGTELIRRGAQLNLRDKHGWNALCTAAHKRHSGFVELLCRSGASLDGDGPNSPFETFLEWTSEYGGSGSQEAMAKIKSIVKATREAREIESANEESSGGAAKIHQRSE